jgi:hypothetical protein
MIPVLEIEFMEDKITIIEGPTPVFEDINDGWAIGLNESPILYDTIFTEVRTFNGPALVERCHRAWKKQASIYLHYKNEDGLEEKAPIVAARSVDSDQGQVLMLWLRQLPAYDDIKDLAEGFNQEEFDEDDEEFDNEDSDDDDDNEDEDDSNSGYVS